MKNRGFLLLFLWLAGACVGSAQALLSPQTGDENRAFNRAIRLERLNQLDGAEGIYLQLLARNPRNTRVYLQLKSLYRRQKRFKDLETLINDRLELFPNDLQSQVELGELFLESGEPDRAVQHWEQTLARYPRSKAAYRLVMHMAVRHQMDDYLEPLIEKGRSAFNDPSLFSLELANVYSQRERFEQATHEYLTFAIHHPDGLAAVSSQLLKMSDHAESQEIIEARLLERMGENEPTLRTLYTHFLFKVGRYEDAFQQHLALGLDTDQSFQRWLKFANNLRKENRLSLALNAFRVILQGIPLHPNNPRMDHYRKLTGEALYGLALTYEKQIIPPKVYRSLAEYFPNNAFFEDPFHGLPAIQIKPGYPPVHHPVTPGPL
ncbi:MAG: tetratricopeptide repeat protein [Fidelibacterota bacterium]